MRTLILFLFIPFCLQAQWQIVRPTEVNWGKVGINMGSNILSVGLELVGDAIYDEGKIEGNKQKMNTGHILQGAAVLPQMIAIPLLVHNSPHKLYEDISVKLGTYFLDRFALGDLAYNLTRDLGPLYNGTVTRYDQFMRKVPPHGKVFLKGWSFSLSFVINISYW